MREQIRLWFYSQFFMSIVLTGRRAVPQGADLREAAGRRRARDARLVGQPHLRRRGVRAHGRRRHALAVLPAAADAEHPLRLQARGRDQAPPADAVELGALPHRLRLDRGLRSRATRTSTTGVAGVELRPLDVWLLARVQQLVARRRDGLRRVPHGRRRAGRRDVRRGSLELVHPPLAAALLRVRRGGVPDAVDGARAGRARVRADHAVPRRAPVADARRRAVLRRRAGVRVPRRLAAPCRSASVDDALLAEIAATRACRRSSAAARGPRRA